jgi:hypothetical protein
MSTRVTVVLLRLYRTITLWFAAIVLLVEAIGLVAITWAIELNFSFWLAIVGSAAKYWTLVVGIMLVSMQMRQFVTNGVTRREFAIGAGLFALIVATAFAAVVVLGHWLEGAMVGAIGERGDPYPVLSAGELLGEFGRVLPQSLAWMMTGALIAIGFYRFRVRLALIVMVLGAVPAGVVEGLLAVDERGVVSDALPYLPALLLSLAATGLAAVAIRLITRDVAIRRTRG